VGSALPLVRDDLGHFLSYSEQEIVTAATTIGAIFGGAILGALADRLGRKPCLFIADVAYVDQAGMVADIQVHCRSRNHRCELLRGSDHRGPTGARCWGRWRSRHCTSLVCATPRLKDLADMSSITELAPTAVRGRCIGFK
jgi:hypothetical protein